MEKKSQVGVKNPLLLCFVIIGVMAALVFVPSQFRPSAGAGLVERTTSLDERLGKMYDIREDKQAADSLLAFRQAASHDAAAVADFRDNFVRGEEVLKQRLPHAKVEYNTDIRIPEVITPDVYRETIEFLSAPSSEKRSEILRGFIKQNNSLIGVTDQQADALSVTADYTNPDGNLSYATLEQTINGVPVFRGEVKAGFTKDGRIIRVINNLAPGLEYGSLSTNFGDPLDAVVNAYKHIDREPTKVDTQLNGAASTDLKAVFGTGDWATTAEKMYFPIEPGVARASWRVLIWLPVNAYYVIVDAETGKTLWHKNISDDQTTSRSYQVYANPNSYLDVADSPSVLTPGPTDPALGTQGVYQTRVSRSFIGNEGANSFNNNGWITDGQDLLDGNAVEAGIDRDGTNGVDAASIPVGTPANTYTSTWNPPPGNPAPGDDPLAAQSQRGAVIQMWYIMNRYHDELYKRGFTEQARNFQALNFGRGGVEADRVSAEGQDSSGTNNANFATPADGGRGRMQMFLWTGPTPDYDGTTDAEVVIHEVTHGTSNRLHNNGSGLGNQGGMMGEGWSDWYAHTMLAEPTDPINGIYTTGGYATYLLGAGFTANYYYGIRRFPKAVMAFTGGPARPGCNNLPCPHNPLTFGHINADCDTTLGTTTTPIKSAFPRSPVIATSGSCSQVHNAGEIWSSALWEVRAKMVQRLGFAAGTTRVLQVVTDGMKLAPTNPMMLQERDAIIAAAAALPVAPEASADVADVREGFRIRGFGFSAQTISSTQVVEAFDTPNVSVTDPFSVSDTTGDNDGFPEPGESVLLSVAVRNPNTGAAISNVQVNVDGGPNVNYGTINDGATVTNQIAYTVPANVSCGAMHTVTINVTSSAGSQAPTQKSFRVGTPVGGAPATFSSTGAITINDNAPASPYPSAITAAGLSGNKTVTVEITGVTHTFPGDIDMLLVGPGGTTKYIGLSDSGGSGDVSNLTFTLDDRAAAQPSTSQWTTGSFKPYNSGASDAFAAPAPAAPYTNAAPGGADTIASVFGTAASGLNGTWNLYVVDDAGVDTGSMAGWKLTFESNDYACTLAPPRTRADFDGDGKSDPSVFRSGDGNWYQLRSTAGFTTVKYGGSGDTIIPGDFDGDGKADPAIFRPDANQANPDFFILNSSTSTVSGVSWGSSGDIPVSGDYDGDGKTDAAVFRPSNATWYVLKSSGGNTIEQFGLNGDVPMAFDLENDGKTNLAVFRPSTNVWYIARNTGVPAQNFESVPFGAAGDILVPGDYDGDNKDDCAVFRPTTGQWIVRKSSDSSTTYTTFGTSGDVPLSADFDGDGKDDMAVYRNGTWWINNSTAGVTNVAFGIAGDKPVAKGYMP